MYIPKLFSSVTLQNLSFLTPNPTNMFNLWILITQIHSLAGPMLMLLYPLYATVVAKESTSKLDDDQWLAYWIIYSTLTLVEMIFAPILQWIPIWYSAKLLLVGWLVLPQFKGAAFLYKTYARQYIREYIMPKKREPLFMRYIERE
ncbi:HVA22-like protein e [Cicer arietinum]|uniref:HVA22-like protein n=1 Tax=Cicer arietinum TaxID=3827 RepID=A0A1S3EAY9_CICAR|nr:HVA22-like protein e [Cicer arietinum]